MLPALLGEVIELQKAAQSGVHSLIALATMALVVAGAVSTTESGTPVEASGGATASAQHVSRGCHDVAVFSPVSVTQESVLGAVTVRHMQSKSVCYGATHVSDAVAVVVQSVLKTKTKTAPPKATPKSTSSGSGPSGGSSSVVYGGGQINFCLGQSLVWPSSISQWTAPLGCYGQIFAPNTANFPSRPSWGWCNWVPEEFHLNYAGYGALQLTKHYDAPRVGAVVWFNPGVQGASSAGHWAELIAIGPNGWGVVEEMNFSWRGGGWGKIDYRFITLYTPGVAYLYA